MSDERLMVLKMIDDGKINAEEGVKLLKAIGKSGLETEADIEDRLSKFSQSVDSFSKDIRERVESFAKDVEPKFKKTSKVVIEKTASILDDLSKTLNETIKNIDESFDNDESSDDDTPIEN